MKKKTLISILGIMMLFSMFSLVSAQESTGGQYSKQGALYMDAGIIVNTLVYDHIEVNNNLTIYMTPYEQSGKTLDNTSVTCRFGVTSPDGSRLLLLSDDQGNFTHISNDDIWVSVIPASFLNETGTYLYNWDCQGVIKGGYFNGFLEVGNTKDVFDTPKAILYGFILVLLSAFLYFALYGVRKAASVEWLIGYVCLSYVVL